MKFVWNLPNAKGLADAYFVWNVFPILGKCLTDAPTDAARLSLSSPSRIYKLTSFALITPPIARPPSNHWKSSISTTTTALTSPLKKSPSKHYKKSTNALEPTNYNFLSDPIKKWSLQLAPSATNKNYAGLTVGSVNNSTVCHVGYRLVPKRDVP